MQVDSYSRTVTFLKVVLPLIALGLLSTLFLISRAIDPPEVIPFTPSEVQERLINRQVTGPYYTSTSSNGDQIAILAETVTTQGGQTGTNKAKDVDVKINRTSGTQIDITALEANINIADDLTELIGEVEITTSQGAVILSDFLEIHMSSVEVVSPDAVIATLPQGKLNAGAMRLYAPEDKAKSQMFFTNGVKLLYVPSTRKD